MRQLLATARRSPASLAGTLVALTGAATMVTLSAQLVGTAITSRPEVHRLGAAQVVVTSDAAARFVSGSGKHRDTETLELSTPHRIPVSVAARLAALPGAGRVVADVSVPTTLLTDGGRTAGVEVHGWSSGALTPVRVLRGHAPTSADEIAVPVEVATRLDLRPGAHLRAGGRDVGVLTVSAVLAGPGADVYLSDATATAWFAHPGQADLLAVLPATGSRTSTAALARAVHTALGPGYRVLTGRARGDAEDVGARAGRADVTVIGFAAILPVVEISLFVIAGAVGLSVAGRRRHFALLRTVGATPGQIRRSVAGELAVLGVLAGVIGFLLGGVVGTAAVGGFVRHGMLPTGTRRWSAPWVLLVACGAGLVVSQISGLVAAWRAGRSDPLIALRDATVDRTRPHPLRLTLGLLAGAGAITLAVLVPRTAHNPTDQMNLALLVLLAFTVCVGLLGPVLVSLGELVARLPAHALGGAGARLALADMRRRPGRIAAAVVALAMAVSFLGTVYLVNRTASERGHEQDRTRLRADLVATAPGGLTAAAVSDLRMQPGVDAAVGVRSTVAYPHLDGGDRVPAVALTPGPIPRVLDLHVRSGRLDSIAPGQVAVSRLEAGRTKVGDELRLYLADGTPYRARVIALYDRSLGFGDLVLPAGAAGGGHMGGDGYDQVLVGGRPTDTALPALERRYAGFHLSTRAAANRQAEQSDGQDQFVNDLLIALIGTLAMVTLVNTLATATVSRRDEFRLLARVGATRRQLLGMAGWQAAGVAVIGVGAGVAAGTTALVMVANALTGDPHPYLPVGTVVAAGAGVLGLAAAAILLPTLVLTRHRRGSVT